MFDFVTVYVTCLLDGMISNMIVTVITVSGTLVDSNSAKPVKSGLQALSRLCNAKLHVAVKI